MRDHSSEPGGRLEVRWVGATALGTVVAFAAFVAVFTVIGDPSDVLFPFLAGGIALTFGAFQQRVIRSRLGRGRGWAVATGLGFGLGMGSVVALGIGERTGFTNEVVDGALAGALGGAVLGSAQWLVLRGLASNARRWVPASIVAWAVGAAVGDGVAYFADGIDLLVGPVVAAAITGIVLVALKPPADGGAASREAGGAMPAAVARRSGALFVAGFLVLLPGVAFAVASQTETDVVPRTASTVAGAVLLMTALLFTLGGLLTVQPPLSGARTPATVSVLGYVAAVAAWGAATAWALAAQRWVAGLEHVFIVASAIAMIALGLAVLRAGVVARWVGAVTAAWSAVWLVRFALPHQGYPPMVAQLAPLLVGIALLLRSRPAADHGRVARREATGIV